MAWTRIAAANQLQDDEVMPIALGDTQLALFRSAGEFHVTDNVCTHQYALLSDGYVEDGCVECPLHQARFDLRTGRSPVRTRDPGDPGLSGAGRGRRCPGRCPGRCLSAPP